MSQARVENRSERRCHRPQTDHARQLNNDRRPYGPIIFFESRQFLAVSHQPKRAPNDE
jgi:hypothetical protein